APITAVPERRRGVVGCGAGRPVVPADASSATALGPCLDLDGRAGGVGGSVGGSVVAVLQYYEQEQAPTYDQDQTERARPGHVHGKMCVCVLACELLRGECMRHKMRGSKVAMTNEEGRENLTMNSDDEQDNVQEIEDARIEELRGILGLPADFPMLRQHDRASAQFEPPRPRDSPTTTPTTEERRRWVRCQHPTPRPDGWTRTIRPTDMKFQWTRSDENGGVVTSQRFDDTKSAYVLKLDFHDDDDDDDDDDDKMRPRGWSWRPPLRQGSVSLVTPEKGGVDSNIKSVSGQELVSYQDIANAQNKSFEDKIQWFQETCSQLCVEWNEGHMRMNVRREYLLSDSMEAVMSLSRKDLRKVWRFEFIDEAGIDAGGLAREWFELVTDKVFDPDMGLWQTSASNQTCMQINPASGAFISCLLLFLRKIHTFLPGL
ncbi:hypothetical protein THAOC_07718, partial [Thalassiosira oceanica]